MKAFITIEETKHGPKWWRSIPLMMLTVMIVLAWASHLEALIINSFLCALLIYAGILILRLIWFKLGDDTP